MIVFSRASLGQVKGGDGISRESGSVAENAVTHMCQAGCRTAVP